MEEQAGVKEGSHIRGLRGDFDLVQLSFHLCNA